MANTDIRAESAHNNPANLFSTFDRDTIASAVEVLVAVLDAMDGDSDFEGLCDEDEISTAFFMVGADGPGCLIADPDAAVDDSGCDDLNDDREEEHPLIPAYGVDQAAGPLPPHESQDRGLMMPHLRRIQATRCDRKAYYNRYSGRTHVEYRLR